MVPACLSLIGSPAFPAYPLRLLGQIRPLLDCEGERRAWSAGRVLECCFPGHSDALGITLCNRSALAALVPCVFGETVGGGIGFGPALIVIEGPRQQTEASAIPWTLSCWGLAGMGEW